MRTLEIRLEEDKYVIIDNGRKSTTTFSNKFRIMAINKMKFLLKNMELPVILKIDDENGKEVFDEEIKELSQINSIK